MNTTNRWLLPDGVQEVLPSQSRQMESLRRALLDLFHGRGYQYVMPPLIEYTSSLLIGLGEDMDLHSFKMVDQLNGRLLAIRPDITPQVARIDAHSHAQEGVTRYCYAGSVLHTVPLTPNGSRSPFQIGAELYGSDSIEADIEVISLMLASLHLAGLDNICLDVGHVGIYKAMVAASGLSEVLEKAVFDALQRKAEPDLIEALVASGIDDKWQQRFIQLLHIAGDVAVLDQLTLLFDQVPDSVAQAIAQCRDLAAVIAQREDNTQLFFDFAELRGYHYHTGLVFAAFVEGVGQSVANGGRYDDIGEVFGRPRPATGFSSTLDILATYLTESIDECVFVDRAILAQAQQEIARLRQSGMAVIESFMDEEPPTNCTHRLAFQGERWVLERL